MLCLKSSENCLWLLQWAWLPICRSSFLLVNASWQIICMNGNSGRVIVWMKILQRNLVQNHSISFSVSSMIGVWRCDRRPRHISKLYMEARVHYHISVYGHYHICLPCIWKWKQLYRICIIWTHVLLLPEHFKWQGKVGFSWYWFWFSARVLIAPSVSHGFRLILWPWYCLQWPSLPVCRPWFLLLDASWQIIRMNGHCGPVIVWMNIFQRNLVQSHSISIYISSLIIGVGPHGRRPRHISKASWYKKARVHYHIYPPCIWKWKRTNVCLLSLHFQMAFVLYGLTFYLLPEHFKWQQKSGFPNSTILILIFSRKSLVFLPQPFWFLHKEKSGFPTSTILILILIFCESTNSAVCVTWFYVISLTVTVIPPARWERPYS